MAIPQLDYWSVPRCWPGECVAILAGGKSLIAMDVDHLRGRCRVIAINRAFKLAPWADWLYGCDSHQFWTWHPEALEFPGTKIVVRPAGNVTAMPARWPLLKRLSDAGVNVLRHTGLDYPQAVPQHEGISPDPRVVRGNNSLAQILSVIHHTGAKTVLLLGADMRGGHFHGGYGMGEPNYVQSIIPLMAKAAAQLAEAGLAVLNCSPGSALPYWRPTMDLRSVLP